MGLSNLDQAAVDKLIHCAIDRGISMIDTAPLYGAGRCEEVVGRAIAGRRSHVRILSKCGLRWDDAHGARMFPLTIDGTGHWVRKDSRPTSILRGIDESLRRLRIDAIDLMQIHHLDVDTPLEESLGALVEALRAGKIRAIGVSNFPRAELEQTSRLLGADLFSVQDEFSLVSTVRSAGLLEFCRQSGTRFLAYSPLARGVLAGKFLKLDPGSLPPDWSAPFMAPQNLSKINEVLGDTGMQIAASHRATLSQVCLSWALSQPGVTDVIAGTTTERQAAENAEVVNLSIDPDDLDRLSTAIAECHLELSPQPPLPHRLRQQIVRVRHFGGRVLRRLGLR
jgi:aryl-alcohol dehydrogenase-like predicted oxidoreductase